MAGESTSFREGFQIFDQDNDGIVSPEELRRRMKQLGNELTDQEVNDILKEAGGRIDYDMFCKLLGIGIKQSRESDAEEELQHAFGLFDIDRDGIISAQEMRAGLASFGVTLNEKEVDQLIGEATLSADRGVTFETFKRVMTANR